VSRVYFTSPSGTAELLGRERAHGNVLTLNFALAALGSDSFRFRDLMEPALSPLARSQLAIVKAEFWATSFRAWWWAHSEDRDHWIAAGGHRLTPWDLTLNTAVVVGSPAVELLARVHATCEIHGYVEGEHRAWLADVIDVGREDHVLRSGMGWEAVVGLLRARDDEPVVMSYSGTNGFPDRELAVEQGTWTPPSANHDEDGYDDAVESWGALPASEQWDLSMAALHRFNAAGPVELHPDVWGVSGFGDPAWSVFDLLDALEQPATVAVSDSAEAAPT
jgi:hypothetical protein